MRWPPSPLRALALAALLLPASGCLTVEGTPQPVSFEPQVHEALLWSDLYPAVVVEVAAVPGREPSFESLRMLDSILRTVAGKAQASIVATVPIPLQGGDYDRDRLAAIHHAEAQVIDPDRIVVGGTATLHVLFLDGALEQTDPGRLVLGTFLPDEGVLAVFPDEFAGAHRVLPDGRSEAAEDEMERHVLLHELGHAFGLVGQRIPMVEEHGDGEEVGHSANPHSVMHHRPPMTAGRLVYGPGLLGLDGDDVADIAAFQARAG